MNAVSFHYSPEVRDAIGQGRPIVVLESTVIAQGLPWPENLKVAEAMEKSITGQGAVPAIIAIMDGVVRIGLSREEIEQVARSAASPDEPLSGVGPRPDAMIRRRQFA